MNENGNGYENGFLDGILIARHLAWKTIQEALDLEDLKSRLEKELGFLQENINYQKIDRLKMELGITA